jgi:HPt (histidine-containing phosphotransfer) domain-containing protein
LPLVKSVIQSIVPITHVDGSSSTPVTKKVPVDVHTLEELVGNDPAVINDFLRDFRVSSAKIATELRVAHQIGQPLEVGAAAHKLKSSSRAVGALALGDLCEQMERAGKGSDTAALTLLLPQFEEELAAVDHYIATL